MRFSRCGSVKRAIYCIGPIWVVRKKVEWLENLWFGASLKCYKSKESSLSFVHIYSQCPPQSENCSSTYIVITCMHTHNIPRTLLYSIARISSFPKCQVSIYPINYRFYSIHPHCTRYNSFSVNEVYTNIYS